ncbi:MAG: DUF1365 domain-containing protein, partial [Deltaproteobacteria bacterium]|nr:DUF1365 domain-containing protein [Deltaproteobacteria bacterium]
PSIFEGSRLFSVEGRTPAVFRRSDQFGDPSVPLDTAVRDLVEGKTGKRPAGPVRLLTHLRYFGHCFNPVSFFYCFDPAGEAVETFVADVSNTPWKERHHYVLPSAEGEGKPPWRVFAFDKAFHVSPFMPMNLRYEWRFRDPGPEIHVHMTNFQGGGARLFDATLSLTREEISPRTLRAALLRHPVMTVKIVAAIHWQALRLAVKRVPFHDHP